MANTQQTLNKIRSRVRRVVGDGIRIDDAFFTFDRDSGRVVTNRKIDGYHFIFNLEGELIKQHRD